jgi:hypothetical protein
MISKEPTDCGLCCSIGIVNSSLLFAAAARSDRTSTNSSVTFVDWSHTTSLYSKVSGSSSKGLIRNHHLRQKNPYIIIFIITTSKFGRALLRLELRVAHPKSMKESSSGMKFSLLLVSVNSGMIGLLFFVSFF